MIFNESINDCNGIAAYMLEGYNKHYILVQFCLVS